MDNHAAVLRADTGETMVLQGVTAKGILNGLLFELTVEQCYRNPAETNIEAVYTFPLPSGAVLLDFEVKLGGKTLTGCWWGCNPAADGSPYRGAMTVGTARRTLPCSKRSSCA